jgi:hypothetical protein
MMGCGGPAGAGREAWWGRSSQCPVTTPPLRGTANRYVSFIQFFGSALQVTPHFHSLVPDGVFVPREGGVRFEALPLPTQGEVERLLALNERLPVVFLRGRTQFPQEHRS